MILSGANSCLVPTRFMRVAMETTPSMVRMARLPVNRKSLEEEERTSSVLNSIRVLM